MGLLKEPCLSIPFTNQVTLSARFFLVTLGVLLNLDVSKKEGTQRLRGWFSPKTQCSMDWFKGKSTGKPQISWGNLWFADPTVDSLGQEEPGKRLGLRTINLRKEGCPKNLWIVFEDPKVC